MIDVLVVDDDFYVARISAHYVSEVAGFRIVGIAHNAASALTAVERGGIDLILLDQHLPNGSGLALTRRLRQQGCPVDVIMATADCKTPLVLEALRAGVFDYLLKPFTSDALRARLECYAQLRAVVERPELDQLEIDRLLGRKQSTESRGSLPKGFSERTAALVTRVVSGAARPVNAQEVADRAQISRSTAQRYLKLLEQTRAVSLSLRYGDSGRPEHLYALD